MTSPGKRPEVSVVMSVYNNVDTLESAVRSILDQEHAALEFIIVDDGSRDGSSERLDAYAAADARVRVMHQSNTGLTKALIRGCSEARGEYIARQDADDVSLPGRLSALRDALGADKSLSMASSWAEAVAPDGEVIYVERRPRDAYAATRLMLTGGVGPPGHGSVMFRSSVYREVGGYRPAFYYAQDSDLWLRMCERGRVLYVPRVLYRYSMSADSMSGFLSEAKQAFARLVAECREARQTCGDDAEVLARTPAVQRLTARARRRGRGRAYYFMGQALLRRRHRAGCKYMLRSLAERPANLRGWLLLALHAPRVVLPTLAPRELHKLEPA